MRKRKESFVRSLIAGLCVFAVLIGGSLFLVQGISSASETAERETVRRAVQSAVLTCYAVESAYPSSLDYLKANYDLAYDEDAYIVVYDAFASNIMPEIRVLVKGAEDCDDG